MRLVLDEGPAVGGLVRRVHAAMHDAGRVDAILDDYLQRLLQIAGPGIDEDSDDTAAARPGSAAGAGMPDQDGAASADIETLTRKELRVLQLLAEGYSNSAMAEKLFVSDSTVRTHLRNINLKLGARSRTQAVAIARRLGLMR